MLQFDSVDIILEGLGESFSCGTYKLYFVNMLKKFISILSFNVMIMNTSPYKMIGYLLMSWL